MLEFLLSLFPSVRRDEDGASAVEYGLLIAGIAAIIVVAVMALGPMVSSAFEGTCDAIADGDTPTAAVNADCQ